MTDFLIELCSSDSTRQNASKLLSLSVNTSDWLTDEQIPTAFIWLDLPVIPKCVARSFIMIPSLAAQISSIIYAIYRVITKEKIVAMKIDLNWSIILLVRMVLNLLAIFSIAIQVSLEHCERSFDPVDIIFFTCLVAIHMTQLLVIFLLKNGRVNTSPFQAIFYAVHVVCLSAQFFEQSLKSSPWLYSFISLYCLNVFLLLCEKQASWSAYGDGGENSASWLGWLTFSWVSQVFRTGFRGQLIEDDLPAPTWRLDVAKVSEALQNRLEDQDSSVKSSCLQSDCDSCESLKVVCCSPAKAKPPDGSCKEGTATCSPQITRRQLPCKYLGKKLKEKMLMVALVKAFSGSFALGSLLRLASDVLLFTAPMVFREIMKTIESEDAPVWKGYALIGALLAIGLIQVTVSNHYFRQTYLCAFKMKTALSAAIYEATLRLTGEAKKRYSSSDIANLVAVDSERFIEVIPFINVLWSGPLQILAATGLLYWLIGISALSVLVVLVLYIPLGIYSGILTGKVQNAQMKAKDERTQCMSEVLHNVRVVKMYGWEAPFEERIAGHRHQEMKSVKKNGYLASLIWVTYTGAPMIITLISLTCYVYVNGDESDLSAELVFSVVAILNVVKTSMYQLPRYLVEAHKLYVSMGRIEDFLKAIRESSDIKFEEPVSSKDYDIEISKGTFTWEQGSLELPALTNVNLSIGRGQLVAVVGRIGSGKTSLLSAILGSGIRQTEGTRRVRGRFSFVPQASWTQATTIRNNILFGSTFDEDYYQKVVNACALRRDFQTLRRGDMTEVTGGSMNLSGGQKQRISLARAAYAPSNIVVLDDPLSALDASVSNHIFDNVIGPEGILKSHTRILVTNNIMFLSQCDQIILMDKGKIVDVGPLSQLNQTQKQLISDIFQTGKDQKTQEIKKAETHEETENKGVTRQRKKSIIEMVKFGRVSLRNYFFFMKGMQPLAIFCCLLAFVATEGLKLGSSFTLTTCTNSSVESKWHFIRDYGIMSGLCTVTNILSQALVIYCCANASQFIHGSVLWKLMTVPLSFFKSQSAGKILNRFSADMDVLDVRIPKEIGEFLMYQISLSGTIIMISFVTPVVLAILALSATIFTMLQVYFSRTRAQLKRLESAARAPLLSHISETLSGLAVITAHRQLQRFRQEFAAKVGQHLTANYNVHMSSRWLSLRIEFLGNFIVFAAALFALYNKEELTPGLAALSITYAMQMIDGLAMTIRLAVELESDCVVLERLQEYDDLEGEEEVHNDHANMCATLPDSGEITFHNYSASYAANNAKTTSQTLTSYEQLSLTDMNLNIGAGQKIGLVGRSGAGKSSFIMALLKFLSTRSGRILVGGTDIALVRAKEIRSKITVIPQEPVLFSGSIRHNLCPSGNHSDEKMLESLEAVGLHFPQGLDYEVKDGGSSISLGQKQLICLARALLRESKILILDEATAAVDKNTDNMMQAIINDRFKDCTVVIIAHRLETVLAADRIVVLDKGQIAEVGKPDDLLAQPNSRFYGMARSAGITSSRKTA